MTLYETLVETIKNQGERLTIQRQLVIEALAETGEHMTIQNIGQYIINQHGAAQTIPEPTVYRVLQWLKQLGYVAQTDLGQSGITYELISTPPHHHLICLNCGRMQILDDAVFEPLRQHLQDVYAFEPRIDHMACFGICQTCRASDSQTEVQSAERVNE